MRRGRRGAPELALKLPPILESDPDKLWSRRAGLCRTHASIDDACARAGLWPVWAGGPRRSLAWGWLVVDRQRCARGKVPGLSHRPVAWLKPYLCIVGGRAVRVRHAVTRPGVEQFVSRGCDETVRLPELPG